MKFIYGLLLIFSMTAFCAVDDELIGGRDVRPGEYPEVIKIKTCGTTNGVFGCASCSAAIVGNRVILTAAHCVLGRGEISYWLDGNLRTAQCEKHPVYPGEDFDMALCKDRKPMAPRKYAHVSDQEGPLPYEIVTLIGYGCTQPGGGGGNDGILRVGEARVTREAGHGDNWFYTKDKSALCFGDSGGPAFQRVRNAKTDKHVVYGVNSRGNIEDLSLLTGIFLPKGVEFMEDFQQRNGVEICGHYGFQCDAEK